MGSVGFGQCGGTQTISYDTLVTGSGNDVYSFTFPDFDPSLGTLTAVTISAVVSIDYGFTLQNVESTPRIFSLKVGRTDVISSSALSTIYTNDYEWLLGNYALAPGAFITKPLYHILSGHISTDSVTTSLPAFEGNGSVNFAYEPVTYTDLKGSANYYFSANAGDTTKFILTYYYCNSIALDEILQNFQASKLTATTAELDWTGLEEPPGRMYEIQKSTDAVHFTVVGTLVGKGLTEANYGYTYTIQNNDTRKLYFRLRVIDAGGNAVFSDVKMVNMVTASTGDYSLYPNPADRFIHISTDPVLHKNWQVEILAADGRSVQKNYFSNTPLGQVLFNRELAAGVYFARIVDVDSGQGILLPFAVK